MDEYLSLTGSNGSITPNSREWAAPIVVVPKANGSVRTCGDFKVTFNPHLNVDQYPLPLPEDLFTSLEGCRLFTKLDLSQAYLQLELDEESQKLYTVNTSLGLFQYSRMPFGPSAGQVPKSDERSAQGIALGKVFPGRFINRRTPSKRNVG